MLLQWLRDRGHAGTCSFCGKRRIACPLSQVARRIDAVIREYYRPAEDTAHVVEESDNPQYWADGSSADEIIQEIAGVEPEVADALEEYLSGSESRDVRDGNDAYYGDRPLEFVAPYYNEFIQVWEQFESRLKHDVRFFDDEGKRSLDELFGDLPSIAGGKAIVTLEPAGESSSFYRARIAHHDSDAERFIHDPAREIGPPPAYLARAGRMNPVGIPAFYGAFSEEVAVAEVRPPVGARVAVGRFSLLRAVRLLDVSFLPFAYHEESLFSDEFDRLRQKVGFLEKFHRRISRPVLPSDEDLEYLPTQAVAAYLASVMGLDGAIYSSTQIGAARGAAKQVDRTQCNIVLFGEAARVEGAQSTPHHADPLEMLVPRLSGGVLDLAEATPAGFTAQADAIPATLRIEPEPKLVKIEAVNVVTSSIFAYRADDGSMIINDFAQDDD